MRDHFDPKCESVVRRSLWLAARFAVFAVSAGMLSCIPESIVLAGQADQPPAHTEAYATDSRREGECSISTERPAQEIASFVSSDDEAPQALLAHRRTLDETRYAWRDQCKVFRVETRDESIGPPRVRVIEAWERRYDNGTRKTLWIYLAPDAARGIVLLTHYDGHRLVDRWRYNPKVGFPRRAARPMLDETVLGTALTYGDFELMDAMYDWTERDALTTAISHDAAGGGRDLYGIRLQPLSERWGIQRLDLWMDAGDLVMRRLDLYESDASVVKYVRQSDVRTVGMIPVPYRQEIDDPAEGTSAVFDILSIAFNIGVDDSVFSLGNMSSAHPSVDSENQCWSN